MATKLPPPFLADVAVELDPRRASDLIASIAPALIGQITAELVARREYVTMGRFVGHLSDEAIAAAVATMDDEAVLQVAFVLEDQSQLSRLFAKLPKGRSAGVIAAAAHEGLWLEALDLLNHLHKRQRREMVLAALALDEPARRGDPRHDHRARPHRRGPAHRRARRLDRGAPRRARPPERLGGSDRDGRTHG